MSKFWLVLDCHFLCWRAYHSTGDLSYDGVRTGITYGFLRDVRTLMEDFDTRNVVFCFDVGYNLRKDILPTYKQGRHQAGEVQTEEEKEAEEQFRKEVKKIRKKWLPMIGFHNILWQKGYESDDVIASVVGDIDEDDTAVIVSADKDLRQLIRHNVWMYNPINREKMSLQWFYKKTGLKNPRDWARVLQMAGCHTDKVPGIPGIGEDTALKFLRGELPHHHARYNAIINGKGVSVQEFNSRLVTLPMKGTKKFKLSTQDEKMAGWGRVMKALGIHSLGHSV